MDISVIILNYKSQRYLPACLKSLEKFLQEISHEIIIINNDQSQITSIATNNKIKIVQNDINFGFAKACNIGAKIANGNTLLFLNPDTKILQGKAKSIIDTLNNTQIGAASPTILSTDGKIQKWSNGFVINLWTIARNNLGLSKDKKLWSNSSKSNPDWISGVAMFIKKNTFDKLCGFDENFFMYFEDVDLCKRIKDMNLFIVMIPNVKVLHLGGKSSTNKSLQKKIYYESQDYYFKKHFSRLSLLALKTLRIMARKFTKKPTRENIAYYCLIFICAFLPFQFALNPVEGSDLAIIRILIPLVFIGWSFVQVKNKKPLWKNDRTTHLLMAFLFISVVSLIFSQNISWSIRKLLFFFSIIPIYFIGASMLNTEKRKKTAIKMLLLGSFFLSLISMIQFLAQFVFGIDIVYAFIGKNIAPFFLGNSFSKAVLAYPSWLVNVGGTTYFRVIGTFPDPHMLSYYFGMLLPFAIAMWQLSKRHSWFYLLITTLLLIADIYTFARSGYVALIAGILITLPLVSKAGIKKIIMSVLFLFCILMLTPSSPATGRLTSSFDIKEGSNQGRISNWKQALIIVKENPLGVGIGMYPLAIDPDADYRKPIYAHNLYLDIAAELGIPALLVFVSILLLVFISFWKMAKINAFFIAGVSSITIFATQSLVETPIYSVHILTLLMLLIVISLPIKNNEENIIH
ncbi:MAG: O-antigen ligase family protein [bacterium]